MANQVSERSERALRKTRILAMNPAKLLKTATSTSKLTLFHSIRLARSPSPCSIKKCTSLRSVQPNTGLPIAQITRVRNLDLSHCPNLQNDIIHFVGAGFTHLEHFHISSYGHLSPEELESLSFSARSGLLTLDITGWVPIDDKVFSVVDSNNPTNTNDNENENAILNNGVEVSSGNGLPTSTVSTLTFSH